MIAEQARIIFREINDALSPAQQLLDNLSSGRLQNFKRRHNFQAYKSHGEICARLTSNSPAGFLNVNEFGLYCNTPPRSSIDPKRLLGKKKSKQRAKFLARCNSNGSENFLFLIIGHAQILRCFNGCGLMYRSTPKAWINTDLFRKWLKNFDLYISQTANNCVLVLLDYASCHGQVRNLTFLELTEIILSPPNTTTHMQTLDADIIASSKHRYRNTVVIRAISRLRLN